jgi:hypothetical protein
MRRTGVVVTAMIVALALSSVTRAADAPPPNILFVMSDDYPWAYYTKMRTLSEQTPPGSIHPLTHPFFPLPTEVVTEGLDNLANRGAFFPVGHAGASFCHPSFQATLTGLYEKDFLAGRKNRPEGVRPYYMVEYLNEALIRHNKIKNDGPPIVNYRYRSLGFAKIWTKGSFQAAGFDFGWKGKLTGRATITPIIEFIRASGEPEAAYDTFCAMKRSECPEDESSRPDPTQPWFVWYAPNFPHYPTDGKTRTRKRIEDLKCKTGDYVANCVEYPPTDPDGEDLEALLAKMNLLENDALEIDHQQYFQNILLFDYWVKHLLLYIDQHAPNTLIVYQGDNGYIFPKSKKANGENAFRNPIMVSWPGHITPGVRDQLVSALDFLPTLVDYATDHTFQHCPLGTSPVAKDASGKPIAFSPSPPVTLCSEGEEGCAACEGGNCGCFEGESMRAVIDNPAALGRDYLIGMTSSNNAYLRTKDGWRLTRNHNCKFKLFDLQGDPGPPIVLPDTDEKNNCLSNSSAPCRQNFQGLDYSKNECVPTPGSLCERVRDWQCDLKKWNNPGNKCTFSCP